MTFSCDRNMAALALVSLFVGGCGQQAKKTSEPKVCAPGTVYSCVRGGCNGHQSCTSDGLAFTNCVCDSQRPDAGYGDDDAATADAGQPKDASATRDAQPMAASELCDNGQDDDGDGDVDCADSDCSQMVCTPQAPTGWQGPVALAPDADATACRQRFDTVAFEAGADPQGSPPSCSTCTCTPAPGGCAAAVDFGTGAQAQCAGTTCTTSVNQACTEIAPDCLQGLSSAYLETKLPQTRGCTASTQKAEIGEARFDGSAAACAPRDPLRGGCHSGSLCLPAAAGDVFEAGYCVWRDGEHDCPGATYSHKRIYYRALKDTRSCSDCNCGGPSCSYRWRVYGAADTSCTSPLVELSATGQCVSVNPEADKLRVGATISGDGSCTPSGGVSQGSVSGDAPVTVCCAQ